MERRWKEKKDLLWLILKKDEDTGKLVGLALWDWKDDWLAARPAMIDAVKDDPFDEWKLKDPDVFHLNVV